MTIRFRVENFKSEAYSESSDLAGSLN